VGPPARPNRFLVSVAHGRCGWPGCPRGASGYPDAQSPGRRRSPVFVGRRRVLAVLATLAGDAIAGVPRVALIEGDAGMGKSALAAGLLSRHREIPVLAASGGPGEHGLAFGMVRQLISGSTMRCWLAAGQRAGSWR
jgi:hypothetical protein